MVAPYRVVSPLPTLAGLQRFSATDASNVRAWVHQAADRSAGTDERLLDRAGRCVKPQTDLVQVLDFGKDAAGRAWVATLPVPGAPLAQVLAERGPLEAPLAVRICARVAEVLEAVAPLGLFPALSAEAVFLDGAQVHLLGFSPPTGPQPGREQVREVGALLDGALAVEGRRADVVEVVRRSLVDGPEAFTRLSELIAALHAVVGGDTRPSSRPGNQNVTGLFRSRAGEVLGSYELVSRLGEGGMGDVYLARHTKLGREVALKLLKPELAKDADVVRRFFQEARVVNEINHPHIVEVIDFVDEPPNVFCVMEVLKGVTLADLALGAPMPLKRTLGLIQQTCEALHAAHTHGVVHRDVKPANIFVCERAGQVDFVKLLDFGIARLLRTSGEKRTQLGLVIGTPAYMSPEQAQGRPVDVRTDIYAVGAVLFELLSGETLSRAERPVLPEKTLLGELIPKALTELVARCISMEPTLRPATALEIGQLLEAIASPPRPATTQEVLAVAGLAPAAAGRGRAKWAAAAAAVVVLSGGAIWATRVPAGLVSPVVVAPPAVEAVIDAGPPTLAAVQEPPPADPPVVEPPKVEPPKVEPPKVEPPKVGAPKAGPPKKRAGKGDRDAIALRFKALKKTYRGLVDRHGAAQLTSLERARVSQAMEDFEVENFDALVSSLPEAEQALKIASQRLGP